MQNGLRARERERRRKKNTHTDSRILIDIYAIMDDKNSVHWKFSFEQFYMNDRVANYHNAFFDFSLKSTQESKYEID